MRTFQFSDAKSHKFWTIDVAGDTLTVTFGKVGTAGQTTAKTFATAEKAQAEADKLIREKTGKGYAETTPKATASQDEAFEKSLVADPHDVVRWSAYSDYLAEKGDPRGEFMAVQLALENEHASAAERKALKKKEDQLLKAYEAEWLGPFTNPDLGKCTHTFARGWLARLEFPSLSVAQARTLAKSPEARLLRELVVEQAAYEAPVGQQHQYIDSYYEPGPDVPEGTERHEGPSLHALCRCPQLAGLRSFTLGEVVSEEYSNCHTNGSLAYHAIKQMPNVEELRLYAHEVDGGKVFALPMPNLRTLELFHSKKYSLQKLAANKTVTDLRVLRCHPHAMDFDGEDEGGAYIRLAQLKAVCRAPWKNLTHLCLRLTDFGDAGAKEIVDSGVLKRLKVLDLQGGCITDKGADLLAACPDLKHLEKLNLRSNAMTPAGVAKLQATGVKVDAAAQHGEVPGDDGEMPEYLFEGDIE